MYLGVYLGTFSAIYLGIHSAIYLGIHSAIYLGLYSGGGGGFGPTDAVMAFYVVDDGHPRLDTCPSNYACTCLYTCPYTCLRRVCHRTIRMANSSLKTGLDYGYHRYIATIPLIYRVYNSKSNSHLGIAGPGPNKAPESGAIRIVLQKWHFLPSMLLNDTFCRVCY